MPALASWVFSESASTALKPLSGGDRRQHAPARVLGGTLVGVLAAGATARGRPTKGGPMTHRRSGIGTAALSASLAAAVLAGCADKEPASKQTPDPTVRVERVIDGDTVVLTRFGKTRLIGVDTPEQGRCGENAATRFTRRRLEDKTVEYELGEEREDRYGRTLAYLTRGDTMHNLALVEEGYATARTSRPTTSTPRGSRRLRGTQSSSRTGAGQGASGRLPAGAPGLSNGQSGLANG